MSNISSYTHTEVGTAALLNSAAVFLAGVAEAPLFFSIISEKRQRRFF